MPQNNFVIVSPSSARIAPGQSYQFTATVSGPDIAGMTPYLELRFCPPYNGWTPGDVGAFTGDSRQAPVGSCTSGGLYTAPTALYSYTLPPPSGAVIPIENPTVNLYAIVSVGTDDPPHTRQVYYGANLIFYRST